MKTISNGIDGLSSGLPRSGTVDVPELVRRGVARCDALQPTIPENCTSAQRQVLLARKAELFRREARWWAVLTDWACRSLSSGVPAVFRHASVIAECTAERRAERYEQFAENARRRAAVLAGER